MKYKKMLCLLIAVLLIISIAGCGSPASNQDAPTNPSASPDPNNPLPGVKVNPNNPVEADKPGEEEPTNPEEEQKGKSWYIIVDHAVKGQINQGGVVVPINVSLQLLMKNAASEESAQGNFIGTCYIEFKADLDRMTVDGVQGVIGFQNSYMVGYNATIPVSMLGQDVNYTEYSGQGDIRVVGIQDVSGWSRERPDFGNAETLSASWTEPIKIRAYPNSGDRMEGRDTTVTFTSPDWSIYGTPPFLGSLYSSDEMSEEDYNKMVDQLDKQIDQTKEDLEKEGKEDQPTQTKEQQIADLESGIKHLEERVKDHENDDPSKYSKAEWEQREALYKANMLELANSREQLAELKK